jgi:hypothetical protein
LFNELEPYGDTSIAQSRNVRDSVMRSPRFAEDVGQPGRVDASSRRTLQPSVAVGEMGAPARLALTRWLPDADFISDSGRNERDFSI